MSPQLQQQVIERFEQTGAYLKGHFRLTSGLHSPEYLQCAKVLQYPAIAAEFGAAIAEWFKEQGTAGVVVALGLRFIFTERDGDGKMTLRRGFAIEPGEKAVLVEDVITTGGSSLEVIELLRSAGAEVLAAGSIIDRSGGTANLGVPRVALATVTVTTYSPEACPMCQQGLPVQKPGSRPGK